MGLGRPRRSWGNGSARRPGGRPRRREPPAGRPRHRLSLPPSHLHVGHEALLDSPAVFIDLFQELQLIVVVATHGGDYGYQRPAPL